jgi:hypothetical protein
MQPETPLILRPRPWKWLGVGSGCLVFTALGVLMIQSGQQFGWLCVIFFGIGVFISVAYMFPNASYLKLDSVGFTMCSFYRAQTFRWEDVSGFGVAQVFPNNKMVMFNFNPSYSQTSRLRTLNVNLVGYEAGLPDNYGLKHEQLAELLNKYKESARAA